MKIKTSELTGPALDWTVAKCEGHVDDETIIRRLDPDDEGWCIAYSTDWAQGGPIIEREWLDVTPWPNESREDMRWHCQQHDSGGDCAQYGPTPLIAAMRCYVASKLGDEVDVPDGLALDALIYETTPYEDQ